MPMPKFINTIKNSDLINRKSMLIVFVSVVVVSILVVICVPIGVVYGIRAYSSRTSTSKPVTVTLTDLSSSAGATTLTTIIRKITIPINFTTTTTTVFIDPKNTCNYISSSQNLRLNCLCNNANGLCLKF